MPRFAVLATMAVAGLAACGSASQAGNASVASLPSISATARSASLDPSSQGTSDIPTNIASGRPQLRVDTTAAEQARIYGTWYSCLQSHGVVMETTHGQLKPKGTTPASAFTACASSQPLEPPALNPDTNPDYNADLAKDINCINRQSPAKVDPVPGGWTFASSTDPFYSTAAFQQILFSCQIVGFGPG